MKWWLVILTIFLVIVGAFLVYYFCIRKKDKFIQVQEVADKEYAIPGLVLFDLDGTLTTGEENGRVVGYFLDKGYICGVTTAGSMYTPNNLHTFDWMPDNLYAHMLENKWVTFNNVANKVVCGEYRPDLYGLHMEKMPREAQLGHSWGWAKALTLKETAYRYGIVDEKKMVLVDNDPMFLEGARMFSKKFLLIPGGKPAINENLKLENIFRVFNK